MTPHLLDERTFEIVVDNEIVEKYIREMIPQVEAYLQQQLHNSAIMMTVRVSAPKEVVKAYNRMEQYQLMNRKNPMLQRLSEEFELEFS